MIIKEEATKELFKEIYGSLIDIKYQELTEQEVADIAFATIIQYANNHKVYLEINKCINY